MTRLASSLGVSGTHDQLAVADIRHADAVESAIADHHRGGESVVLTGALEDAEDLTVMAARSRVRIPGLRVAVEPLPGNPLALAIISSLADDADGDSAWMHAALDDLRQRTWSGTWLTKLSHLTRPNPTVWQQIASWLPGAAFLAEHSPAPSVTTAKRAPLNALPARPGTALLHSPTDSWVVEAVLESLGSTSSTPVAPARDLIDSYGTSSAIEFVAIPEDFREAATRIAAEAVVCTACGMRHARTSCPYCRMTITSGVLS
ncbi:hypothetical protein C6I20_13015 [Aeromicrobium sp. A1-2]|uniref:hypothetical protein n=1 Tax=Aeromicrobium sp. A1-2 TaxID=2107713 RepID=UPI000E4AA2B8|nr:hypothetical protein [Aeromicrobium sp. A1-2]AXT86013.1 hypothetical protein C6I20_13015 [Aeromicrobium sp. A1-2]